MADTTSSTPPQWMDFFNNWYTNEYTPWAYAAGGNPYELSRWNTDPDAARQKLVLDKQYTDALAAYNQQKGTNIQPDQSVLGVNAQPNMWWRVPDSGGGGLFGTGIGPDISWTDIRDPLEAAAVVAGNYILPGSSLISGQLVSEGAKEQLSTPLGTLANIGAGVSGGLAGNAANYGKIADAIGGSSTADALAADNIDVGGGWNPATGTGDAATAAAAAATGVTSSASTPHLFTPSGLDVTTGLPTAAAASGLTGALSSLTPAQTAALAKAGISVAGLLGGGAALGGLIGGGGGGTVTLPAQDRSGVSSGSAQYTPEYYAAIQSKYNQMMPQQPRDVTTELKNWYETKYAPSVTVTPKAV